MLYLIMSATVSEILEIFQRNIDNFARGQIVVMKLRGSRGQGVWCLPGMREVLGSNPLGGNILCSPSPSEETINRGPNTPIPTTHALICEELKETGSPPKVVP